MTELEMIEEARELFADTIEADNPEYLRGMCELIARCFPRRGMGTDERAGQLKQAILSE